MLQLVFVIVFSLALCYDYHYRSFDNVLLFHQPHG